MNYINIKKRFSDDVNYNKFTLFSVRNSSENYCKKLKLVDSNILFLNKLDLQQ